ncbi:MAG TPA: DinB family protein [Gemmatimonadales bacterium]|nr:DinB family protein [Gemmatimonadales bacterium]
MTFPFSLDDLLDYSDWDRAQWHDWFRAQGPAALAVGLGPHTDGRFATVGELIRHIFSAERRYVERVLKAPLTDTSTIAAGDVEALFQFGRESRRALRELLATFPESEWGTVREMQVGPQVRTVTARAMVIQTVTHELRHWAQIATLLRLAGQRSGVHDYIASPLASPGGG